jgi:hypothetical protein
MSGSILTCDEIVSETPMIETVAVVFAERYFQTLPTSVLSFS